MRYVIGGDQDFQLDKLLNNGLTFFDNFRGTFIEETLDLGENTIQHSLGFRPHGYFVIYKELSGEIYGSRIAEWTQEVLFLVSSVGNQTVRLFVM